MLFRYGAKQRAADVIEAAIDEMRAIGIDRATIIRTLFNYFIHEIGYTPEGGEEPSHVENMENLHIVNEVNDRWRVLLKQIEKEDPDLIQSHIV